jgi:hypothetical protein
MVYTKIPKFVFFIYESGSLSLDQNPLATSASSLPYTQCPITRLITMHKNAVRIITTFSYKVRLILYAHAYALLSQVVSTPNIYPQQYCGHIKSHYVILNATPI